MSYSQTLGALTASVVELGDYDTSNPAGNYVTGPFVLRRTAARYKEAYEVLAAADPDRLTQTSLYVTTSTTGSMPLPSADIKLRGLDVMLGGCWQRLERVDPSPLNSPWGLPNGTYNGLSGLPGIYRLQGESAFVAPDASAGQTFRFTYVPEPPDLSTLDPTTALACPAGLDEYVIWSVLYDCRVREDRATEADEKMMKMERDRLVSMGRDRDSGQPASLEDPIMARRRGGRRRWG